jgi:hypothetical protein
MRSSTRVHILLACMPKSGSTFLADVIGRLPGFRQVSLIPSAERREQELDEFCLRRVDHLDYVGQVHVRHSHWTEDLCQDYGLTQVVLVRSLFDVVVSFRDHLRREATAWPMVFAEPHHAELDDAALELMIVRLALPWYVNFYMGWRRAPGAMMVSYETLIRTPAGVVGDILAFAGADTPAAEIEAAVARVRRAGLSRLNVGVAGRGAALSPEAVRAVLDMVAFYPEAQADPYLQSISAQGEAILAGAAAAPPPPAPLRQAPASRRRKKARSLVMNRLVPAALLALAVLYWLWPGDLRPDSRPGGHVDDAVALALLSIMAGRLSKYKVRLRAVGGRAGLQERFRRVGFGLATSSGADTAR